MDAKTPLATVVNSLFSHPQAQYFASAKADKDQVEDYAKRKSWSMQEAERWLAPVLNYDN